MTPAVLVGNNLALLIAADSLAGTGRPVVLLTDNKRLGGHFYGFSANDIDFDIGVVFLEWLVTEGQKPPLQDYNPYHRYDWTRFALAASEWVRKNVDAVPIELIQTVVEGQTFPDYIFTNHLDVLKTLNIVPPALPVDPALHPSQKLDGHAYETLEYGQAAQVNHGPDFHNRLIDGFLEKLLAGTNGKFLARYHRNIWAPLFYPETLAAAIKSEPHKLRPQTMWTAKNGFVGKIVRDMVARLEQAPHAQIVTAPITSMSHDKGWTIALEDGAVFTAPRIAIGLTNERAATMLRVPQPPKAQSLTVGVLLARIRREAIGIRRGCVTIADKKFKAYRLCDQDMSAGNDPDFHRISIEVNTVLLDPATATETLRNEIRELMGVKNIDDIEIVRYLTAKDVLPLAEKDYVESMHDFGVNLAAAAPGARLSGANLGYGVATLNDQVVQGLMLGEWLNQ